MLVAPPPWTLTGNGVILIAHFPEAFVRSQGFLAPYQHRGYRGWIGTVMLVDYQTSPVGPYQELLFIPGLFQLGKRTSFSISKIYVSSQESIWNGRRNWGIPKEQATFSFSLNPDGSQTIRVDNQGETIIQLRAKPWGIRFPITTKLVPGFRIVQKQLITDESSPRSVGQLLLTRPSARGSARLAFLSDMHVKTSLFPDLNRIRPLVTLVVENFQMTFPPPETL
ncbi:acetoacetate decarboxylase family protein [Spirosoma utsteinense]|uniref:Acetoacetate decarboxylase n=1 Tax=Spirosoma utsteinense TaxID=2585773 RepID=A0ABR6WA94_9BACT|nr:acetoacetate decarboxylase family protein [Spirosoma utsteinense]MBC3784036.1 hypothetical protein [Spirosoma utsteinense]MBC3793475.1 hypothetical protein [Spirosoma utsteinense]